MRHMHVELLRPAMIGIACYSCGQGLPMGKAVTASECSNSRRLELCADCAGMLCDELRRVFGEASRSDGEMARE